MTEHQNSSAASEVLDFLNSIEGAGYGGMASFEIARQYVREMVVNGVAQGAPKPVAWRYSRRGVVSYSTTRLEHCIALGWFEAPLYENTNANPASRSTATATAIAGDDRESMETRPLKVASPEVGSPPQCSAGSEPVAWRWKWPLDRAWTVGTNNPGYASDASVVVDPLYSHLPQTAAVRLRPMSEAPKDREIFALHYNRDCYGCADRSRPDAGNFHPIQWKERPWEPNYRPRWGMRWNDEYNVTLNDFAGWIDPADLPSALTRPNRESGK